MTTDPHPVVPVPDAAEVVLHEQRLSVGSVRVPHERVVLRRRVISEVRQVEVTVRREELEIQRLPVGSEQQSATTPGPTAPPLVVVLREEVPVVQLRTQAYERVTVTTETVSAQQEVVEQIDREQVEITQHPREPTT